MIDSSLKMLIITEKPSVAGDIAKALGGFEKKSDHYDSDKFMITWAVGHLVELLPPEEIDPKYKRWLLQDLPILPVKFEYRAKDGQKERLQAIKALAKRAEIKGIINACDAGREGELIFREIFDYCQVHKSIFRLWLQSMTPKAIKAQFESLKPGAEFDPLGDAARCRAESDWLIGMNATRALTRRLQPRSQKGSSWSVGRVQTPTLALLAKREIDVLRHRPEPFWTVEARFSTATHEYSAQWIDTNFKKVVSADDEETAAVREREDRIFDAAVLHKVMQDIEKNKSSCQASEFRKESKEIAPQLFDLTTLQREANRRFGMSASRTLQSAQRLYERHKLLTYPRTDSKCLPEDYVQTVTDTIKKLSQANVVGHIVTACNKITKQGLLNKERVFNDKGISDHFAIIPTGESSAKLEGDDERIFELVMRRFLAAFMPQAVWAKVERTTVVGAQTFRTRVQDLQVPGWREVYGLDSEEESKLPKLEAANVNLVAAEQTENTTKPAPRLSEAKLLSLMEHAGRTVADENFADALKEKGIGTPATRSEIIENLVIKEYAVRTGKALKATAKGIRLLDILNRIPIEGLSGVELTGDMEHQLKLMEKGKAKRTDFMKKMYAFTTDIIEKARSFDYEKIFENELPLGRCIKCKQGTISESFWTYKCSRSDVCDFIIWKEKNQRYVDKNLVSDLLSMPKVGPIEFQTSAGTSYTSFVAAHPDKGMVLVDENGEPTESIGGVSLEVIHEELLPTSFLDQPGRLYVTEAAYHFEFGRTKLGNEPEDIPEPKVVKKPKKLKEGAEPAKPKKAAKPAKKLAARMPRVLCHHNVTMEEFKAYVCNGATPAITDFKSKKGRTFAASLHMKPTASFEFKFEARKKPEGEVAAKPRSKRAGGKAKVVKKTKADSATAET